TVQFARTRLSQLIKQTALLLQPQAVLRNVQIVLGEVTETAFVYCDENQIKQVLINIVKNGIEAMPQGGSVTISAEAGADGGVKIRIADEGP
ncbi:ATP-binding protein, partial [Acinetobacter baumannii]